jgi:hypothetical protein
MIEVEIGSDLRIRITEGEMTLRQSSEKSYQDCHRYFGWERVENLSPLSVQWPLVFGTATHKFLQERGRGVPVKESLQMAEETLREETLDPATGKSLVSIDDLPYMEQHIDMLRTMAPAYDAHWGDDSHVFIPLGNEIKGRVSVGPPENKIFLVFKTDKIVNYLDHLWLIDHKTMGKNDDREFAKYAMDIQPTAYIYGVSKVLGIPVAGIIIDALIKTKVPQFRRESFLRTEEMLTEFEVEFTELCQEIAWRFARVKNGEDWKSVFYKNTGACFKWGRACSFLPLCQRDTPVMRMGFRKRHADYQDDPKLLESGE